MSSVLLIGKETDTILSIAQALAAAIATVSGPVEARARFAVCANSSFDVVITDPDTTIDEGLALIEEMRDIRPGMKAILLAPSSTPEEIIAALRARVFVCFSAPFDAHEIAGFACRAATDSDWRTEIEVLSAQPDWISLRANCHILTAERVVTFLGELQSGLPEAIRDKLMLAFREILLSAMGHAEASRSPQGGRGIGGAHRAHHCVLCARSWNRLPPRDVGAAAATKVTGPTANHRTGCGDGYAPGRIRHAAGQGCGGRVDLQRNWQ